jgi:hypothetical protein
MKRLHLSCAAAALLFAACSDNRASIEITGRAAPGTGGCTFAAGGLKVLGTGTLDVAYGSGYGLAVYVKNNLEDPNVTAPGSVTDAKAWRAEAVQVRLNPKGYLDRYGANPQLLAVTGEAVLPLTGQTTPPNGESVEVVETLSSMMIQDLTAAARAANGRQRVVLGITLRGRTLDNARVDSGEWYYAVEVCEGCLPAPACAPPAFLVAGNCFNTGQDNAPVCVVPAPAP